MIKNIFLTHFCRHTVFLLESFHDFVERIFVFDEIDNHTDIDSEVKMIVKKYKILLSFLIDSFFFLSTLM